MVTIDDHGYGCREFTNIVANRPPDQIPIIAVLNGIKPHDKERLNKSQQFVQADVDGDLSRVEIFEEGLNPGIKHLRSINVLHDTKIPSAQYRRRDFCLDIG